MAPFIRRQRGCSGSLFRIIPTDDHQTYGSAISDAQLAWETKKAEYESWAGLRDMPPVASRLATVDCRPSPVAWRQCAFSWLLFSRAARCRIWCRSTAIQALPTSRWRTWLPMRAAWSRSASLPFISPSNRMTATQTCEGYVQLTYVDGAGRMRQPSITPSLTARPVSRLRSGIPSPRGCAILLDRDRSVITPTNRWCWPLVDAGSLVLLSAADP